MNQHDIYNFFYASELYNPTNSILIKYNNNCHLPPKADFSSFTSNDAKKCQKPWRDGRVDEGGGLENRFTSKGD